MPSKPSQYEYKAYSQRMHPTDSSTMKSTSNRLVVVVRLLLVLLLSHTCCAFADISHSIDDSSTTNVNTNANAIDQNSESELASLTRYLDTNKEFWESLYQNSMLNTKTRYDVMNGERVCFTCPIDRVKFNSLYMGAKEAAAAASSQHQLNQPQQAPPRITINWASQLSENRLIFFCRNNTKIAANPVLISSDYDTAGGTGVGGRGVGGSSAELEYTCENNRLCLLNAKSNYPDTYQCLVKSYVENVKLNVIVQIQYMALYFTGDSVKFDYLKEVQVHENQLFTVKCEMPESNPISNVNVFIENRELKLTRLDKKSVDNRMSINTYSYEVNATRNMNGKRIKCEALMKDLPADLANSIDLRSHVVKEYTISVFYLPICVYRERIYRTGINRSITIECPINGSNPEVTYYKMIPPSTRTKFELIDTDLSTLRRVGRYRIAPASQADFGLYECIPRSLAGTAKCDIYVELGATPNPPEQCSVQFARVNNKTFAQFSCRPGFNQGGTSSFLTIYELSGASDTNDDNSYNYGNRNANGRQQLKLSGRVNIDESKVDKEVPYITPADEDKYYEFLIMQENNYGNSTSVLLTLGTSPQTKSVVGALDSRTIYMLAGGAAGLLLLVCVCACCCCSDLCGAAATTGSSSSSSSKADSACCKCCCAPLDQLEEEALTYKKAPPSPMDVSELHANGGMGAGISAKLLPHSLPPGGQQSFPYATVDRHSHHQQQQQRNGTLLKKSGGLGYYEYYDNTSTGLLSPPESVALVSSSNAGAASGDHYSRHLQQYSIGAAAAGSSSSNSGQLMMMHKSLSSSRNNGTTTKTVAAAAHYATSYGEQRSGVDQENHIYNRHYNDDDDDDDDDDQDEEQDELQNKNGADNNNDDEDDDDQHYENDSDELLGAANRRQQPQQRHQPYSDDNEDDNIESSLTSTRQSGSSNSGSNNEEDHQFIVSSSLSTTTTNTHATGINASAATVTNVTSLATNTIVNNSSSSSTNTANNNNNNNGDTMQLQRQRGGPASIFNNNVNVSIGSGVESVRSKLPYLNGDSNTTSSNKNGINKSTSNSNVKQQHHQHQHSSYNNNNNNNNNNHNNNNGSSSTYTTINDVISSGSTTTTTNSNGKKFIKTENGLVYTPLDFIADERNGGKFSPAEAAQLARSGSGDRNDSRGAVSYNSNSSSNEQAHYNDEFNRVNAANTNSGNKSVYGTLRKGTNQNKQSNSNNGPPNVDSSFKHELSLRLKSINKDQQPSNGAGADIYSKNFAAPPNANSRSQLEVNNSSNSNHHQQQNGFKSGSNNNNNSNSIKLTTKPISENLSNSTATTSMSSASSCASNSDLILKRDSNSSTPSSSSANSNSSSRHQIQPQRGVPSAINDSGNKNYSLLKTSIHVNGAAPTESEHAMMQQSDQQQQQQPNGNNKNKPPILKPKPRTAAINNHSNEVSASKRYAGGGAATLAASESTGSDSMHNQSNELLLGLRETSLQTSPSTSVTDISSTNCTPQHYSSQVAAHPYTMDNGDVVTVNNGLQKNQQQHQQQQPLPRSRSNSLTRNHQQTVIRQQTNNSNINSGTKATTTFTNGNNGSKLIYSTKTTANATYAADVMSNTNGMITFSNGVGNNAANYESLNRKDAGASRSKTNPTKAAADEMAIDYGKNGSAPMSFEETNRLPPNRSNVQRTLERRAVKNSEC